MAVLAHRILKLSPLLYEPMAPIEYYGIFKDSISVRVRVKNL